jgi:hypothetical protein
MNAAEALEHYRDEAQFLGAWTRVCLQAPVEPERARRYAAWAAHAARRYLRLAERQLPVC